MSEKRMAEEVKRLGALVAELQAKLAQATSPLGVGNAEPCREPERMGEYACKDRSQCWEPCGEMGNDPRYVRRAPPELAAAVDASMGLTLISIRLPSTLIEDLKALAAERGTRYQTLAREFLIAAVANTTKSAVHSQVNAERIWTVGPVYQRCAVCGKHKMEHASRPEPYYCPTEESVEGNPK